MKYSFNEHLDRVVAKCCRSWIVMARQSLLGYEYMLTPHLCKSNYCAICRPRNLIRLRKKLFHSLKGERWRLLTLTFPNHAADRVEQLRDAHRMLKVTIQKLRRKYSDLKYARCFEAHKSGYPHVHVITNHYIPVQYLSEIWRAVGGGHIDVREPRCTVCGGSLPCITHRQKKYTSSKQAGRYLTEEFEKKWQDIYKLGADLWNSGVRSVMTSRNIKLQMPPNDADWYFLRPAATLADAMTEYERLVFDAQYNGGIKPSIEWGKNRVMIGAGYRDIVNVDFFKKDA